jgi:A/G-specific adenine glycosylase
MSEVVAMHKPMAKRTPLRNVRAFRNALLGWFHEQGRDYPWRRTTDPYAILVSEIMLQQTTVAAVLQNRRFERFLATFPDLATLATASEAELLREWEGLGYYNRVRNLQKTARAVLAEHNGRLPSDPILLATLPGIGRYTAGAVASFAFNRSTPIVDANIARVLTRLFNHRAPIDTTESRHQLWSWADSLVPPQNARAFNSAFMELGQTHCSARAPACLDCPVHDFCSTRNPASLPAKKPKRKTIEVIEHVLFIQKRDGSILLAQEDGSRRNGLWKLPERSHHQVADFPHLATRKYSITHHRVTLHIHRCQASQVPPKPVNSIEQFHAPQELAALPMPSPFRQALLALLETER